jgi:hypothetical protein
MSKPLGTTGQIKKFRETMKLAQHVMRAREAANVIVSSLDFVLRSLLEGLDIENDEAVPPSTLPRPPDAPTAFNPKWDSIAFEKHVLSMFKNASTEQDKENVRALIERGVTGSLLTEAQAEKLRAKLK